ncbi:alanyl-tRNA synthetase [secondary endosymbiont of Heteropsylla cubana]|uniref:Alanine--tRNA ligase n=1 Tax=secondary endosymbiont of Heteropsylla cubana TaxID=134287 RepID=J3VU91_9ENTR|nr:alanine--tRNA ligase [secondary endosymbiont of Heteropsylla cubana]AFP85681.1 alanyl-tRNA synthetase [secondary endosymbiont of Heteropsylla cubana]
MGKNISEIRHAFLDFFHRKGHEVISSSSLIPTNDPSLLFTNAGMNQFKDVFLGLEKRPYQRATTSQFCIRTGGKHNDLEHVGYTERHHTFFEMLGNFSFGNYFKKEAIRFAWELLTEKKWFNLPKENLLVTVYANDHEAYNIWRDEIGMSSDRIIRIGDNKDIPYLSDNFWQMGTTGPCGPCSEIFYDHGEHFFGNLPGSTEEEGNRYIEIWNLVFMQFNREIDGTLSPLPQPSVDTGMGLERISAVLQKVNSIYDTDLFKTLISSSAKIIGTSNLKSRSLRVIADHIRTCAFLISEGILPSNEERGYVLRRIIRRGVRHGNMIGAKTPFFYKLVKPLINVMGISASQIDVEKETIEKVLYVEEEQFYRTLERGLILLNDELKTVSNNQLDGKTAFRLYDTYGFPIDLTTDICRERNMRVDLEGFNRAMADQRKQARLSHAFIANNNHIPYIYNATCFFGYEQLEGEGKIISLFYKNKPVDIICCGEHAMIVLDKTPFYAESGGQVGDHGTLKTLSAQFEVTNTKKQGNVVYHIGKLNYGKLKVGSYVTTEVNSKRRKYISLNHSATHLLHSALRKMLGNHIKQKGFQVNEHYLRFDFSYHQSITVEQIYQLEEIVNEQIRRNLFIQTEIMPLEDARNKGAIALFGEKYDTKVRVLIMEDFSIELCGGTHARHTGNIGLFRIISESCSAAHVRRIEAITGATALKALHNQNNLVRQISQLVKSDTKTLINKVKIIQERHKQLEKKIQKLQDQQADQLITSLSYKARNIKGANVLITQLERLDSNIIRRMVEKLKNRLKSAIIVFAIVIEGDINLIAGVTENLNVRIKADDIITYLTLQVGGKGGGRPGFAQAGGGNNVSALPKALKNLNTMLYDKI